MNNSEKFHKFCNFNAVDIPPIIISMPWEATRRKWEQESLPKDIDLYEYFEIEPLNQKIIDIAPVLHPSFDEKFLEEHDDFVIKINNRGVKEKNFSDKTSMPEFLEYPIKTPCDINWLRKKLSYNSPGRIASNWKDKAIDHQNQNGLLMCHGGMYFAFLNEHAGTETLLYMYYDSPDFVHEVNELQCSLCENILNNVLPEIKLDFIGYHEDMAFKNGSLISPKLFKEFMTPYYKRIASITDKYGVDIHWMDSDGNIKELIPLWLECGIKLIGPMEVAAGMDPVQLRKEYGHDLLMYGGFDKRILAHSERAIKEELDRLKPVIEEGGYLPACDHAVPPDVPFKNYCYFIEGLKSIYGI